MLLVAVAVLAGLSLLTSSAHAAYSKPKPGKWVGKTRQIVWEGHSGSQTRHDYSSRVTFRVRRIKGTEKPRYKVVGFRTQIKLWAEFGAPDGLVAPCSFDDDPPETKYPMRAPPMRVRRGRFSRHYFELDWAGTGFSLYDVIVGAFRTKLTARGFVSRYVDSGAGAYSENCHSGRVRWRAHHV